MSADQKEFLTLALDVDRLMRLINVKTQPKAKSIDEARIGPFGGMILMTILDMEPVPAQNLARQLGRDKAQMTRAVQMLERKGLLERHKSSEDGRMSLISLTDDGRNLVSGFQNILAEVVEEVFGSLDNSERRKFGATLTKVLCEFAPDTVLQRNAPDC